MRDSAVVVLAAIGGLFTAWACAATYGRLLRRKLHRARRAGRAEALRWSAAERLRG